MIIITLFQKKKKNKQTNKTIITSLKSWDSICTPKCVGGLGIKKTEGMNKALVAKMTWAVASNADKMWVRVFNKKYVRSKKFMRTFVPKQRHGLVKVFLLVEK